VDGSRASVPFVLTAPGAPRVAARVTVGGAAARVR
jgi:hypothetical protein